MCEQIQENLPMKWKKNLGICATSYSFKARAATLDAVTSDLILDSVVGIV